VPPAGRFAPESLSGRRRLRPRSSGPIQPETIPSARSAGCNAALASTHIVVRSGNARVTAAVRLDTCSLT
jgi:hypothetical protein